jgi:hypothetical protein
MRACFPNPPLNASPILRWQPNVAQGQDMFTSNRAFAATGIAGDEKGIAAFDVDTTA